MANNLNTSKGLLVWLPLTKDLSNQGIAKTNIISNATYDASGKLGGCYKNGKILSGWGTGYNACAGLTAMCWCKFSDTTTNAMILNSVHNYPNNTRFYVGCYNGYFSGGLGNTGWGDSAADRKIETNKWYHVCMTAEGTKWTLYINGNKVLEKTSSVSSVILDGGIYIGEKAGYYNDFRIYSYALSPQEIKEISRGLVGHWLGNDPWVEGTINLATQLNWEVISGSVWGGHTSTSSNVDLTNEHIPPITGTKLTITYSGSGGGGVSRRCGNYTIKPNTKYTMSMYIKATDDLLYWHLNFLYFYGDANGRGIAYSTNKEKVFGDWYRIWGTFTTGASLTSILPYFYSYPIKEITYYLAGLQLEEKDHMTAYVKGSRQAFLSDISGNHLNLEVKGNGITLNTNTPRYDKCLSFDGNGYLETNNLNINSSEPHTLSFWFYPKADSGLMICSFNNGLNLYTSGRYISLNDDGDGTSNKFGNWLFTLNTWYHIAITFNGSTARLYVNGEDKGTAPTYRFLNGPKMIIGAYINGVNYRYTGMLSDIRLYATALDTTAIQELKALGH